MICTGDSDLSPLVQKLRELDRQVIGVGIRKSTSKLLPPACDEFMFCDNLVSDDEPTKKKSKSKAEDDGPTTNGYQHRYQHPRRVERILGYCPVVTSEASATAQGSDVFRSRARV